MTEQEIINDLKCYRRDLALLTMKYDTPEAALRRDRVKAWMQLLPSDEKMVIQKHLIEGLDWNQTGVEMDKIWGYENGRCERTLRRKQMTAVKRIQSFMAEVAVQENP